MLWLLTILGALAAGSGHWIHLDEPTLVVETIREVVELSRSAQPMEATTGKSHENLLD